MTQPSEWHRIYQDAYASDALALARDADGNYLLAGQAQARDGQATEAWLQELDPMGLTRLTETFSQPDRSRSVAAAWQVTGGDWLIAGTEGDRAFLMRLSPKLKPRWTQRYLPAAEMGAIAVHDACAVPGGSFLVGQQGGSAWCALVYADGRLSWAKTLPKTPGGSVFEGVTNTSAGYVALAGSRDGDFLRIGMSMQGHHEWEAQYGATGADAYYDVLETRDGCLLFAGETDDFGAKRTNHFVTKVDLSGQVQWEKVWGHDRDQDGLRAIAEGEDAYYLAGYQDAGGIIITCDPAGKLLRQQYVQPVGDQGSFVAQAILVDDPKHVVLAGRLSIHGETGSKAYGGRIRLQAKAGPAPQPLPPPEVVEPEVSLTRQGEVQLSFLAESKTRSFLPVHAQMTEGRYQLSKRDWEVGQRFQLTIEALPAPYLYVFSLDNRREVRVHYPRHEVTPLDSSSLPLILPHPDTALSLEVAGTDHIVLLFAEQPIENFAQVAASMARSRAPLYQSLRTQLGPRLVTPQAVRYEDAHTAFTAAMSPYTIVPLIIAVESSSH
ncbi:MAG: hypothetical protein D6722_16620 [Bacteroidetes bacterium]|nr:MAG: hypothetical protein D6722_16620 [Bacteroidota bacterium]